MLKFLGGSGKERTTVVPLDCNEMPLCLCHCAVHPALIRMPVDCQQTGAPCEVSSGNEDGEGCMESSLASLVHMQSQALNVN